MNWTTLKDIFFFFALTITIFLFSGCLTPTNYLGRQAAIQQRQNIENSGKGPLTWQTNDVIITYSAVNTQKKLTLSGTVQISDSVLYTFPTVSGFYLHVYLLDQNGIATSRHDITPLFSHFSTFPDKVQFNRAIPKDTGTTSFVFSYWGVFEQGKSMRRARSEDWEIHHNPFRTDK